MGPFGCLEIERFSHLLGEISWYYGLRIQWQDSMPHSIFKHWKSTGWYAVKTKGMNHHESPLVVTIRWVYSMGKISLVRFDLQEKGDSNAELQRAVTTIKAYVKNKD